jgi:hypothetical protein
MTFLLVQNVNYSLFIFKSSYPTHLPDILLKTALKKFKLNANKTLDAKIFSCSTVGLSLGTSETKHLT